MTGGPRATSPPGKHSLPPQPLPPPRRRSDSRRNSERVLLPQPLPEKLFSRAVSQWGQGTQVSGRVVTLPNDQLVVVVAGDRRAKPAARGLFPFHPRRLIGYQLASSPTRARFHRFNFKPPSVSFNPVPPRSTPVSVARSDSSRFSSSVSAPFDCASTPLCAPSRVSSRDMRST